MTTKAQTALRRAHCLASHRVDVVRGVNFRASADEQLMRAILRAGHKHLVDVVVVAHRCFGRRIQGTGERLHRCSDTDRGSDAWMRPNESGWGSTHTFQHFIDLAGGRALHEVCADRQLRGGTQVAHLLLCSKQTNKKPKKQQWLSCSADVPWPMCLDSSSRAAATMAATLTPTRYVQPVHLAASFF